MAAPNVSISRHSPGEAVCQWVKGGVSAGRQRGGERAREGERVGGGARTEVEATDVLLSFSARLSAWLLSSPSRSGAGAGKHAGCHARLRPGDGCHCCWHVDWGVKQSEDCEFAVTEVNGRRLIGEGGILKRKEDIFLLM